MTIVDERSLASWQDGSQTSDMQGCRPREAEKDVLLRLRRSPVVTIVSPHPCGRTTFVKQGLAHRWKSLHVDLENPSDPAKRTAPEALVREWTCTIARAAPPRERSRAR